ncbi:MAG TPA: gamma-glutamylcyclotransferase [Conexibacter sp.]|nr:gamma-glutamylcyclotransferase [Conexibacter sp.]
MEEFVFGYASLSALLAAPPTRAPSRHGYVTDLRGARRGWGVAADNALALPGYKRYRAADGSYPPVRVAFLDLFEGDGTVNGVCVPADAATLAALDRRERNYVRVEVTERIAAPLGRTWAYAGSPEGRARLAAGREAGTAVVTREYLELVVAGFAALGAEELARFHASTELDGLPVRELERVDLGGRPAPRAG